MERLQKGLEKHKERVPLLAAWDGDREEQECKMRSFSESLTLSPFSRDDSETFSLCCWLLWMAGLEPNSV